MFDELAQASEGGRADYSGLSHRMLDTGVALVVWPFPAGSSGTPRMFLDRFAHPDGRARLVPVRAIAHEQATGRELALVTGRLMGHYQSGAQTRRVPELAAEHPELVAQIHPTTARDRSLGDGDRVRVRNEQGSVIAIIGLSTDIRPDTVFLPFHFAGDASANLLTSASTDPISAMPEFKHAIVEVEPDPGVAR